MIKPCKQPLLDLAGPLGYSGREVSTVFVRADGDRGMPEKERIRVRMSDGSQYEGDLQLAGKGRATDVLNLPDPFIVLDRIESDLGPSGGFVILNKAHVVSVVSVR